MISKIETLKKHQGFMKYFENTSWLFFEKILRIFVGIFVTAWIARYLGPEYFGTLSYAQSFVGLFSAIASLGLDVILVRELVRNKDSSGELIATGFILKIFGAFVMILLLVFAANLTSNNHNTNILIYIIGSAAIFQSFNIVDIYFQSEVLSRYVVKAKVLSLFISSIVKIVLIIINAPLIAFAFSILFDSFILACSFLYFYISKVKINKLYFNKSIAISLLREGWLMMIASMAILIYMKIDQVMIKMILDNKEVGQYAAAVRISEGFYFLPVVIVASLFPAIVKAKEVSEKLYFDRLQKLFQLMVWISIPIALFVTFFGGSIMELLYGGQYSQASTILVIHIWAGVFVFLSVANDKWFYIEKKANLLTIKVLLGVISNVLLNIFLIPYYGIVGAAIATIISYSVSVLFSDLFFRNEYIHRLFIMKIKALLVFPAIMMKEGE